MIVENLTNFIRPSFFLFLQGTVPYYQVCWEEYKVVKRGRKYHAVGKNIMWKKGKGIILRPWGRIFNR